MPEKFDPKVNVRGLLLAFTILASVSAFFLFQNSNLISKESDEPPLQRKAVIETGLALFPTWDLLASATFPLLIDGEAPGTWFFEANFPVEVRSKSGELLGQGFSVAQEKWMTEEAVPFYAQVNAVENVSSYSGEAQLVIRKANPSGLPEHEGEFSMPILIDTTR